MTSEIETPPARREPLFNAPGAMVALFAALIGAHVLRTVLGFDPDAFAAVSVDLAQRPWTLISYLFVHASWAHVLMNSAAVLAFGAPTARLMGLGAKGAALFWLFFLVCGVISALGYGAIAALAHPSEHWALVGASGAASGLFGAATRIMDGRGRVGRIFCRSVVGAAVAWIAINAAFGLSGLTPGAAGLPVAWEAHIVGFFAGLLLIGGFGRLARGGDAIARPPTAHAAITD